MNRDNSLELLPLVDAEGHVVGKATRGECHNGSRLLHPVVHLHLFDLGGRLYMQRRPDWKDIQPGKWDTAVGGHVDYGESVEDALVRETREEIGLAIAVSEATLLKRYVFESSRDCELVNVYMLRSGQEPAPTDELDSGRFWTREEIIASLGKGVFTPNFEQEYMMLFGAEH